MREEGRGEGPVVPYWAWAASCPPAGGEAEVEEALSAAVFSAGSSRIDHVLLSYAHEDVAAAVAGADCARGALDAVGAIELASICAAVRAADAALKAAGVRLVDLHLARGIGGKGYVVLTGDLSNVDAAVDAGVAAAGASWVVGREVIANPDASVHRAVEGRRA